MASKELPFTSTTRLVMALVLCWSTASHLAMASNCEGGLAEAGLPSRNVRGEELQDLLPMEPLWDIILPSLGLLVGTSLDVFGMQLTLGLTFAQPLLLQLLPSLLGLLERFHERLLAWHLGGIFGQPMLVAQVAVARAERQQDGCLRAFGVLVGVYALGAALGVLFRWSLQLVPLRQAWSQILILAMVVGNLLTIWYNSHLLGEHGEDAGHGEHHPEDAADRKVPKLTELLGVELWRTWTNLSACRRHLAARGAILLGLTSIMGPAPLPPFGFTPGFTVFWFDVVGVVSYAILVPQLEVLRSHRLRGLEVFFVSAASVCGAGVMAALLQLTCSLTVAMLSGLILSSCCAVTSCVLAADMSEKATLPADVGVRLAWGLLCGGVAQYVGAHLGQVLFLQSSWLGVCSLSLACVVACRYWCRQALDEERQSFASACA